MRRAVIILVLLIPTVVSAEPFSKTDYAMQGAITALKVADWGQTLDITRRPDRYHETNPILGEHPSRGRVNTYFVSSIVLNAIVARVLPNPYRRIWQTLSIIVQVPYVYNNYQIGLRVRF